MIGEPLTPERRKLFEDYGLDLVKADLGRGGIQYLGTGDAKRAAILWIKEKEELQSQIEQGRHSENIEIARQSMSCYPLSNQHPG